MLIAVGLLNNFNNTVFNKPVVFLSSCDEPVVFMVIKEQERVRSIIDTYNDTER